MQDTALDHKAFLKTLTTRPGVYRMLDSAGNVLYVGKAGDLKQRVSSYFRTSGLSVKTRALMVPSLTIVCPDITMSATSNIQIPS